jgi:hypothetical protein
MKNIAKILFVIVLGMCCFSCAVGMMIAAPIMRPIVTNSYINKTLKRVEKLTNEETGKTVIFVPMAHVGTEKNYTDIRAYLDSLKTDGFVTFYEGLVHLPFHLDTISDITEPIFTNIVDSVRNLPDSVRHLLKMRQDTLSRKSRYILNLDPRAYTNKYATKENKSDKKKKYVTQYEVDFGLTTANDIWVDYTTADLVALYEKEFGEVPLTAYDFATPLDQPYKQKNKSDSWTYSMAYRNDLLQRRILESDHKKIAVVYGAAHTRWVKRILFYQKGYEEDEEYDARKLIENEDEK